VSIIPAQAPLRDEPHKAFAILKNLGHSPIRQTLSERNLVECDVTELLEAKGELWVCPCYADERAKKKEGDLSDGFHLKAPAGGHRFVKGKRRTRSTSQSQQAKTSHVTRMSG
jgi:hypothetical protein